MWKVAPSKINTLLRVIVFHLYTHQHRKYKIIYVWNHTQKSNALCAITIINGVSCIPKDSYLPAISSLVFLYW